MRRQCEAQHQQHQTQHRVGHKKHSVQLGHGPAVLRHLGLRVIPHIGAAQTHTQQQKICNDGAYGAVYAVFTGPQLPLHDGGIYQREDGTHCHGDIGEDRTRPHLIYLQKVISFRAVIPSAENMISVYYTVFVTPCKAPSFAHSGKNIGDDGGPSGDAKLAERYLSASLSCSGMSLVVDILQLLLNHVGVYLCGGDIRMAQHLLNGSQVCSVLQQVGCKGVP